MQRETIRELLRQQRQAGRGEGVGEEEPERPTRPREYVGGGGEEPGEFPEYLGATFDEIDWTEFDWDDVYEDVGDEDEDQYGEDAS